MVLAVSNDEVENAVVKKRKLKKEIITMFKKSVSDDYIGTILNDDILNDITANVFETSAYQEQGGYNEDDIKLAIGRILIEHLDYTK